ncbi:MAG: nucleotide sugar dehydrogenase, partial [Bacteroidales bacterium]|nr:nucleotide sugar dehydrogenase [Bacteroidales bacterium]
HDVIEAASSKWNFVKLFPGLVGGHCIGVDPYYLIEKAKVYGVLPRVMSNARQLNDSMGVYVANQVIKCMNKKGILIKDAKILILGFTFKENCADIRNTKVVDIYNTLSEYTDNITIFDTWADAKQVSEEYNLTITSQQPIEKYDAIILAVAHKDFESLDIKAIQKQNSVVYDVKGVLPKNIIDARL